MNTNLKKKKQVLIRGGFYCSGSYRISRFLQNRVNNESEALLADVRGADSKFENEQHRHAELARIRREERQALQENTFQPSALVLGLAQARQINLDSRYGLLGVFDSNL